MPSAACLSGLIIPCIACAMLLRDFRKTAMKQDLTIHQLRLFLKVAETQSISKAASAMVMPQPALSRLIARVEKSLGATLLERGGEGVVLTPAGERFRDHAAGMVCHHDQAFADVQAGEGTLHGEVRIAAPESVANVLFVPLIKQFRRLHPQAAVRAVAAASLSIPALLDNGMIDIGVIGDTHAAPGCRLEPVCREDFFLIGPQDADLVSQPEIPLRQLDGVPLILNAMPGGFRGQIDRAFQDVKRQPKVVIEIDANDPLLDMVLDGEGFAILPFSSIARKHYSARLSAARIVSPRITRKLLLATPAGRALPAAGREAAAQIRQLMTGGLRGAGWR